MGCAFCEMKPVCYLVENEYFYAIRDIRPVTCGHCLIVAKRHVGDFFGLKPEEMESLHSLAMELKELLDREFHPDGYNLGMNCGRAAGQSVFHFHLHMIPRQQSDRKPLQGLREYVKELL